MSIVELSLQETVEVTGAVSECHCICRTYVKDGDNVEFRKDFLASGFHVEDPAYHCEGWLKAIGQDRNECNEYVVACGRASLSNTFIGFLMFLGLC